VFSDRLVSEEDRQWFGSMVADKVATHFSTELKKIISGDNAVIYGNFIDPKAVNKVGVWREEGREEEW